MLTKNEIKYLKSLHQKKERYESNCFLCEGEKIITEALRSDFIIKEIYSLPEFESFGENHKSLKIISSDEMRKISSLQTPPGILALIEIPEKEEILPQSLKNELFFILDQINDPGNLGTIIRIADWFGIKNVICSSKTTDVFNQKCVQSSMGSIFRVNVQYTSLNEFCETLLKENIQLYAAVMDGKKITQGFTQKGGIILGSESHGIQKELLTDQIQKITIPSFGGAESLNVSVAAGIIAAFCRN